MIVKVLVVNFLSLPPETKKGPPLDRLESGDRREGRELVEAGSALRYSRDGDRQLNSMMPTMRTGISGLSVILAQSR